MGQVETYTLDFTPGLLERGVAIEEELDRALDFFSSPSAMLATRLMLGDELERARPMLERAAANAAQRGDEGERAWVLFYLMWVEWLAGRWQLASDYIAEAMELASQTQDAFLGPLVLHQEAFLDAYFGRVEQARKKADESLAIFESASSEVFTIVCLSTLGHLALALGNLEAAGGYLRALPQRLLSCGWHEAGHPLWPDTIETLIALGELEQARAYLERYEALARRFGRRSRAGSARGRGLLAAAEGNVDDASAAFERSLSELAGLPYPFERGRTLLALGSVRRQAPSEAAGSGSARAGAHDLRRAGGPPLGGEDRLRTQTHQWPPTGHCRVDRDRGAGRRARCGGSREQGDRIRPVHERAHSRSPPLSCLPQARHPLASGAREPACRPSGGRGQSTGNDRQTVGVSRISLDGLPA